MPFREHQLQACEERRVTVRVVLFLILVVAVIGGGAYATGYYARASYFVGLKGDRVTIFMPNSIEFVLAFYATLKAGGVVNPINAQSKEREVRFQIEDSGAKAVLVHEALWPVIQPIAHELASARLMASTGADATGPTRFDDLVAEGGSAPGVQVSMDDLAALPYTSGTTGFPKGVMLTHRNLTANQQQCFAAVPVRRDDVFLNVLPFFHIYALNLLMSGAISLGASHRRDLRLC